MWPLDTTWVNAAVARQRGTCLLLALGGLNALGMPMQIHHARIAPATPTAHLASDHSGGTGGHQQQVVSPLGSADAAMTLPRPGGQGGIAPRDTSTTPAAPLLTLVTTSTVQGTACAACTVQVYFVDASSGSTKSYPLASGIAAADGTFVIPIQVAPAAVFCATASATDAQGSTSPLASTVCMTNATPTDTPSVTPPPVVTKPPQPTETATLPVPSATLTLPASSTPTPSATTMSLPSSTSTPPPSPTSVLPASTLTPSPDQQAQPVMTPASATPLPPLTTRRALATPTVSAGITPDDAHLTLQQVGHTLVIAGDGFALHEQIALALDNILLDTAHGEPRASSHGTFRVVVPEPAHLLNRANDMSALGIASGRTASVALIAAHTGVLQSYFAGGMDNSARPTTIMLTNTTTMPTHLILTLYVATGRTEIVRLRLQPHAHAALAMKRLASRRRISGLALCADHLVQASVEIGVGQQRTIVPGSVSTALRWSLIDEPAAVLSRTMVALLNPDPTRAATITLRLLVPGQRPRDVTVLLGARRERVVALPHIVRQPAMHLLVFADRPVVVAG